MSSPSYSVSSFRRPSFLLLQDEPPLAPKGHSALTSLLMTRPTGALPSPFPFGRESRDDEEAAVGDEEARRMNALLNGPHVRSMRLIGNSNPRYRWERYWKTQDQLQQMPKKIRSYYERTNYLIQQYLYIDRLLDSSLPHDLLNEYNNMPAWAFRGVEVPATISEEPSRPSSPSHNGNHIDDFTGTSVGTKKVKRTPKDIYRPTETTPLFKYTVNGDEYGTAVAGTGGTLPEGNSIVNEPAPEIPWLEDDDVDSGAPIVALAIYINFAANAILLAGKIAVVVSVPSVSVLASLVDAMLDFLSTAIVWITTWLISQQDQYSYPVGRRRLEPLGVLVFSVIMITSFVQVALEAIQRLASGDHSIIELGVPAIAIMLSTIAIKGMCWLWCRMIKNSSVQALASDASTDVIFNAGSIAFPLIGYYARIWWLDALGGLLLSLIVIFNWSQTSSEHIRHLSGFSATADQRNILLYLTMRFAKTIKQIQGLQAYHGGDKLIVEVDIVLDASTSLKDSHDLSESLQYVLESVPIVDRAFVHVDYASYNLPTHMQQQPNS